MTSRRAVLGLLVAIAGTGCVAWRTQNVTPRQLLQERSPEVIRVTTRDSAGIVVHQPRIVADSLTGHPSPLAIQRIAIPVADITSVATRYRHIGKSLIAGIAIVAGVSLYFLLQTLNTY